MRPIQQIALRDPLQLVAPVCLLLGTLAAGYVVKWLLFRALHRWAARTSSQVDDVLTRSLGTPIMVWSVILGVYYATEWRELPERSTRLIEHTLLILVIISLTMMASRLAGNLVRHYGERAQGARPVTTLCIECKRKQESMERARGA